MEKFKRMIRIENEFNKNGKKRSRMKINQQKFKCNIKITLKSEKKKKMNYKRVQGSDL